MGTGMGTQTQDETLDHRYWCCDISDFLDELELKLKYILRDELELELLELPPMEIGSIVGIGTTTGMAGVQRRSVVV